MSTEPAWPFLGGVPPPGSGTVPLADQASNTQDDQLAYLQAQQVALDQLNAKVTKLEKCIAEMQIRGFLQVTY